MAWLGMIRAAVRLAWPHLLQPWRSPLVRWRMETFGVVDDQGRLLSAAAIDCATFYRFTAAHRGRVIRFLRWAVALPRA